MASFPTQLPPPKRVPMLWPGGAAWTTHRRKAVPVQTCTTALTLRGKLLDQMNRLQKAPHCPAAFVSFCHLPRHAPPPGSRHARFPLLRFWLRCHFFLKALSRSPNEMRVRTPRIPSPSSARVPPQRATTYATREHTQWPSGCINEWVGGQTSKEKVKTKNFKKQRVDGAGWTFVLSGF